MAVTIDLLSQTETKNDFQRAFLVQQVGNEDDHPRPSNHTPRLHERLGRQRFLPRPRLFERGNDTAPLLAACTRRQHRAQLFIKANDADGIALAKQQERNRGDEMLCVQLLVAEKVGFVSRLTDGAALDAALELAAKVAANGPLALIATKRIINERPDWNSSEMWKKQMEIAMPVVTSADAREGSMAFAEKRKPKWTGQ